MGDNSSAAPPTMAASSGPSLLWVPYLSLTAVLLLMTLASFLNYHMKNREKYKNEKIKKVAGSLQQQVPKYRVTVNMKSTSYDIEQQQQQHVLKPSCDSNSTVTTSLDSVETGFGVGAGYDPVGNNFACYQNAAFIKSEPSLVGISQPDMFSNQDERGIMVEKVRRIQNGGWNVASDDRQGNLLPLSAALPRLTSTSAMHPPRTAPRRPVSAHLAEGTDRDQGSSYWETPQHSSMAPRHDGMTKPPFKVYLLDNMTLHLASPHKTAPTPYSIDFIDSYHSHPPPSSGRALPQLDKQLFQETQCTYLSPKSDEGSSGLDQEEKECPSISSYATYV